VDEETFSRAFEDVPTVQLFSARELEDQLTAIRETIADPNKDWSKRVDAVSSAILQFQSIMWSTEASDSTVDVLLFSRLPYGQLYVV
jgi:hypothetical protein